MGRKNVTTNKSCLIKMRKRHMEFSSFVSSIKASDELAIGVIQ